MSEDGRVVVVGAGAAGLIAAWNAARNGAQVTLLEKTDRLGTKILVSGGGKCNVTHDGPLEDVLRAFRPNEARFIRPACYRFPNTEIVRMLTERGLGLYTRPDGRIFPVHQTAKDVVRALGTYLDDVAVDVRLETPVREVLRDPDGVTGVETDRGIVECRHLVLAVGGSSYPKTGTTGDGYPWVVALGHSLLPIRAALAPVELSVDGAWHPDLAGIALRDVLLKARQSGKEIARWRGDLLFTHRGLSGPTVLGVTRIVSERWTDGPVSLEADLRPDEPYETVLGTLKAWFDGNPKRLSSGCFEGLVPERLTEPLAESAGLDPAARAAGLPKKTLNRIVETVKGWRLGTVTEVLLEKGEVVAGGVPLDEVDPQTMRSLRCPGLYLCGEILDIAGPVGGYNLQAAFATGFVAGETAAKDAATAAAQPG